MVKTIARWVTCSAAFMFGLYAADDAVKGWVPFVLFLAYTTADLVLTGGDSK